MAEDIDGVTAGGETYDIVSKISRGLVRATMESTSTNKAFVITAPGITELYDGCTVIVKNTVIASTKNCTFNLNNLGAKRIWLSQDNAYCTTHWGLNQDQIFVYDATNTRWEFWQGRDANTDTKVRQTLLSTDTNHPLLMAYSDNTDTSGNVDNVSYRNNDIYANPSTGEIVANNFVGNINGSPNRWVSPGDSEASGGTEIDIEGWDPVELYILVRVHSNYQIYVPIHIPVIAITGTSNAHQLFRGGWFQSGNNGAHVSVEVWHLASGWDNYGIKLVTCFLNSDTVLNYASTKVYLKI